MKHTDAGIIPSDWNAPLLSEISNFENGKAHEQFIDDKGDYIVINSKFISTEGSIAKYSKANLSLLEKGDIAIVMSDIPNGKALAKCFLVPQDNRYTLNQRIGCIKPFDEIDNDYLYYKLNRNKYFLAFDSGSGQTNLKKNEIRACPIALPPTLAEQTAIATALNDADALIQKLEQLIAKERHIKTGAMQELLRPKEGWEVKKLGEVFTFFPTANNSRSDLQEEGEINYIHYGDIHTKWKGFIDCSKVNIPFVEKEKIKGVPFLEEGDLLVADASEDYEGIGECVEIKNIKNKKIVGGLHTLLLRGNSNLIAIGFRGYLKSFFRFQQQLIANANGVSVYGISKSSLKSFELYLPPLDEQTRIAQILSDMDNELQALEKQLEKYKLLKQGMMQNLLTGKIRLV